MKKKILYILFIITMVMGNAVAEEVTSVGDLTAGLTTLVNNVARTDAVTFSTSRDISSGYIGYLPHFSLELSYFGVGMLGVRNLAKYFDGSALSSFDKASLETVGFGAVPLLVTGRVGGVKIRDLKLPIDFAFSIGGVSKINTKDLGFRNTDISFSTFMLGFEARTPVFTEQRLIPGVSVGLAYEFKTSEVSTPIDLSGLFGSGLEMDSLTVKVGESKVTTGAASNVISLRFHANKTLFFIEPYLGIQPSLIFSSGFVLIDNEGVTFTETTTGTTVSYADAVNQLSIDGLEFGDDGISSVTNGVYFGTRLYWGVSLKIWSMYFNMGGGYEPINDIITATFGGRYTM